jgi:lactoylglutathione lyase
VTTVGTTVTSLIRELAMKHSSCASWAICSTLRTSVPAATTICGQRDYRRDPTVTSLQQTPTAEEINMELIHTCYRITDPARSVAFYEALGLEKRRELPIREEAMNYFLGVPGKPVPELELTYNFGVDSYELGTAYGHIALTIENMTETLEKLAAQGIEPERPPYSIREGGSLLCFVRDPDNYRIELIERNDY